VFADNETDSIKQQYQIMYPAFIWSYEEFTQGGKLKALDIRPGDYTSNPKGYSSVQTLQQVLNKLQQAISSLRSSESFGIMMGDILKAYQESGLYTMSTIDGELKFNPLYSPEFVVQIQNRESLATQVLNTNGLISMNYNGGADTLGLATPG